MKYDFFARCRSINLEPELQRDFDIFVSNVCHPVYLGFHGNQLFYRTMAEEVEVSTFSSVTHISSVFLVLLFLETVT